MWKKTYLYTAGNLNKTQNVLAEGRSLKPSLSSEDEERSTLKGPNY
jgi:hypothetical protein